MEESLFRLPDELILAPVLQTFPCRERQIRSLATLLHVGSVPSPNPPGSNPDFLEDEDMIEANE